MPFRNFVKSVETSMEVKRDKEEGKTISNKLAKMSIEENDPLSKGGRIEEEEEEEEN